GLARIHDRKVLDDGLYLEVFAATSLNGLHRALRLASEQQRRRRVQTDHDVGFGVGVLQDEAVNPARDAPLPRPGRDVMRVVVDKKVPVEQDDVPPDLIVPGERLAEPLFGELVDQVICGLCRRGEVRPDSPWTRGGRPHSGRRARRGPNVPSVAATPACDPPQQADQPGGRQQTVGAVGVVSHIEVLDRQGQSRSQAPPDGRLSRAVRAYERYGTHSLLLWDARLALPAARSR